MSNASAAIAAANSLKDHFGYPAPVWLDSVGIGGDLLHPESSIVIFVKAGVSPNDVPALPETWEGFRIGWRQLG